VWVSESISAFSFYTHYQELQRGMVDSRDLIYFFSVIGFLLTANAVVLELKKGE
jgi:ABC-2 type transport system permease protein